MNFTDWRRFGFHCSLDDRPSEFATALCAATAKAVRENASRGEVEVEIVPRAAGYGYQSALGLPFLVAEIRGTGDLRSGIPFHFVLRAVQHYDGPVPTRQHLSDNEPTRPRRRGDLVLWEQSATGYALGPTAMRDVEPHIVSIVQRFFVTLYGARR